MSRLSTRIARWPWDWKLFGLAAITAALFWILVHIGAWGERDPDRIPFDSGSPVELTLDAGHAQAIYMTAQMSAALSFDYYPSDFECVVIGPAGSTVRVQRTDDRRYVDGWQQHWSVASFTPTVDGQHTLECTDQAEREAPLLLVSPPRWEAPLNTGWAWIAAVSVGVAGGLLLLAMSIWRWLWRH